MTPSPWSPLPDAPAFPATGYALVTDRLARLLQTRHDVLLIQAEAMVALEAVATSLGQGSRALNVITSPYGRWFGAWLRRAGATVTDLVAPPCQPIDAGAVAKALASGAHDLVALVHAESSSGILNPLPEIAQAARAAGALLVIDAVASFGGHPLPVDDLGIDVAVIGPQKALGGPAGVSAIAVSPRAWSRVAPAGPAPSVLSLADQKTLWLEAGRGALPGTPSALEFHALAAALDRVEAEGLDALQARHARAGAMARAGVRILAGRQWVPPQRASNLVTAAPLPEGLAAATLLQAAGPASALTAGAGPGGERLVRLTHTGARARPEAVFADLAALGAALRACGLPVDYGAALAAAAEAAA